MITQLAIMVFGASAIWFVGRKEEWSRWGYILGMCGQPFWIYESYTNEQWGILLMTLFYAYSWSQGILNYWIFPVKKKVFQVEKIYNKETFKKIPYCSGKYEASDLGRIRNIKTNKILKQRVLDNGLARVNLFDGKKQCTFYIHRLVMAAFNGILKENVRHKDGNKMNNKLSNLKYCRESHFRTPRNGGTAKQVKDKTTGETYMSVREASVALNMNYGNLSSMLNGNTKNTTSLCIMK